MKPILLGIWTDSSDFCLEDYTPSEIDVFGFTVQMKIGSDKMDGFNYFHFYLCTPKWLFYNFDGPKLIRHMMLVKSMISWK